MRSKQRWIINIALLMMFTTMAYTTFFPGREQINDDITQKVFSNSDINKLFKIRNEEEKKYFFIKDKKNIQVYELNDQLTRIKNVTKIPFTSYWFSVKDQGMETYLVLFSGEKKKELLLFDNDIRLITKGLESFQ